MWDTFGPGAVGVGWDGRRSASRCTSAPVARSATRRRGWPSDEGQAYSARSSEAWGAANVAAGADPEVVERNMAATTAFYGRVTGLTGVRWPDPGRAEIGVRQGTPSPAIFEVPDPSEVGHEPDGTTGA